MKILNVVSNLVLVCGLSALATAWSEDSGVRLTPGEIDAIAPIAATAGTSGVSGIQTRVISGNPMEAGLYTIQLTVPAHTRIEAHTHPDQRIATVIRGTWHIGYGTQFDEQALKALAPGSFYTEPPGLPHFARTGEEPVTVQITGIGPTGTEYVSGH